MTKSVNIQEMKFYKIFSILLIYFTLSETVSAFTQNDIKHYKLENGLEVYYIEDTSSPVIRMELDVKAGYTNQTERNAGYFSFYANLKHSEANADTVKFVKTSSPNDVEKSIVELSEVMRPVHLSDGELKEKLNETRAYLEKYYAEPAGLINSAIDSKVFPESPWKRSSGAVPALFNSGQISESRALLDSIAENYYVPSNSIFFISGNITESTALELIQKHFGKYSKAKAGSDIKPEDNIKASASRKYVIHDKSFSDEMTQICIQYKELSKDEAEVLSQIWNENDSVLKKTLLKQRNLNILGSEYIDVSSADDSLSSRLIIQSLLGSARVNPVVQADLFLSKSREEEEITDEMLTSRVKKLQKEKALIYENSSRLMEAFADFVINSKDEDKSASFFNQDSILSKITAGTALKAIQEEEPFIFVLVNSNVYQKNAKAFKAAGFNVITGKTALWFNQEEYKGLFNRRKLQTEQLSSNVQEDILKSADRFIKKSEAEITSFTLSNGIPLVVKQNTPSSQIEISLIIAGGDLTAADDKQAFTPGLTAVLAGSVASNIRSQLDLFAKNGVIEKDSYSVHSKTYSTYSTIDAVIPKDMLNIAVQSMYTALIFCDITPATADMVTYDERTHWRLKSGSMEFQLLCNAIRLLYSGTKYPLLYEDEKDKPEEMDFSKILNAYPLFLDAARFSFVITGGFNDGEKVFSYLNDTFGTLETQSKKRFSSTELPRPKLKEAEKRFTLRHLFLTDIPKEKAGKMPAVLIPTTRFLDPALFCFIAPHLSSTDIALFNALLLETAQKMNEKTDEAGSESEVHVYLPDNDFPFAQLAVTKIEHSANVEKIYRESVQELKDELKMQLELKTEGVIDLEKNELLARLESKWIMEVLQEAGTNEGTASLIKKSFINGNPKLYLEQYRAVDKAELEDYFLLLESYFPEKPLLRLYSKDSKK